MNTDTRYIMAAIKFTLITVTCMLVYMSYNATAAQVPDVEAKRPVPANSPKAEMANCEQPNGVDFPTGVVIQQIGGEAITYTSHKDVIIGRALDLVIENDPAAKRIFKGYRILGFCK